MVPPEVGADPRTASVRGASRIEPMPAYALDRVVPLDGGAVGSRAVGELVRAVAGPAGDGSAPADGAAPSAAEPRATREQFSRFMMRYKFAIDEVTTKVSILREEFTHLHDYNPIEHVNSRLKSPASLQAKLERKGIPFSFDAIAAGVNDIAGVRITCSFTSDVHRMFDALIGQTDIELVEVRDYIRDPKPNGYKSLHAIVEVPVFLSDGPVPTRVEIQFRTVAMDFWASLDHKIRYKFDQQVPGSVLQDLAEAAKTAAELDLKMERLHAEVHSSAPRAGF